MVLTQERREDLVALLETLERAGRLVFLRTGDGVVLSAGYYKKVAARIAETIRDYHERNPHQKGIPVDALLTAIFPEVERKMGRLILLKLIAEKKLCREDDFIALPDFAPVSDRAFSEAREKVLAICRAAGWELPLLDELTRACGLPAEEFRKLIDLLKRNGDIAILDGMFVLALELLAPLLKHLRGIEGGFTLAQARDLTGSSRKYVLPVLEYLDGRGVTRRAGDKRIFTQKA